MLGQEAKLPVDMIVDSDQSEKRWQFSKDYLEMQKSKLQQAFETVRKNASKLQQVGKVGLT